MEMGFCKIGIINPNNAISLRYSLIPFERKFNSSMLKRDDLIHKCFK